jgi:hypothetical protein
MDTCTVETGLLKKKPCGNPSVTRCANCEQPLCSKHAVAQLKESGLKSGKFMCKDCDTARAEVAALAPAPHAVKKPAEAAKPAPAAATAQPAAKPAPVEPKPADDGGAIEFTPSKDEKK